MRAEGAAEPRPQVDRGLADGVVEGDNVAVPQLQHEPLAEVGPVRDRHVELAPPCPDMDMGPDV